MSNRPKIIEIIEKRIFISAVIVCLFSFSLIANNRHLAIFELKILIPPSEEKAYAIAGETFADMWENIIGIRPEISYMEYDQKELPESNVILIGSDEVNPLVHELIRTGTIDGLGLQYGGDNYRLLSLTNRGKNCLIIAGGSGRSTVYAVYDFFRKQAGAEYFWDGDVIPHLESIDISGVDILEKPHFEYRGLRYFAHRGLHRFQAEHWDLDDWKQEIDWMMKKRFNLFMLRTGVDDLFQRTFPENVPYPPTDSLDPDAQVRSYNDRTSFWPLKYRGELRKEVLKYARERGLIHPEDVGTITHWYSHTPSTFYKNKPDFPVLGGQRTGYFLPTQLVWNIEFQETWDAYWKLTQTHINEFGGGVPTMFHTIGLAERLFGDNDYENLQYKLYTYRKTQELIRRNYNDAPLLVASWDFLDRWKDEDVVNLLQEFDPNKTIILDYAADNRRKVTFKDWGFEKRFPWIFGAFHSFARNSDIHEDYSVLGPRIELAAEDSMCRGLVVWPETSHNDTYFLEYIAQNSWQPSKLGVEEMITQYCSSRYSPKVSKEMEAIWKSFLEVSQTLHWWGEDILRKEPQFRVLTSNTFLTIDPSSILKLIKPFEEVGRGLFLGGTATLKKLITLDDQYFQDNMLQRDVLDMTRTIISRALFTSLAYGTIEISKSGNHRELSNHLSEISGISRKLMSCFVKILSLSDDFSMLSSLEKLDKAKAINGIPPTMNPYSEATLKGNSENNYCRSHHFELAAYVYEPEVEFFWERILAQLEKGVFDSSELKEEFKKEEKIIVDSFYETSLSNMNLRFQKERVQLKEELDKASILVERLFDLMKIPN